jgi:hypothetical protein
MKRDEIEVELRKAGWRVTVSSPTQVVDFQRMKPYNRLILYPSDLEFITLEVLRKLIATDIPEHGEIINEAREKYEKAQTTLEPSQEEAVKEEEQKIREKLKALIDKIPPEKLSEFSTFIVEFVKPGAEETKTSLRAKWILSSSEEKWRLKEGEKIPTTEEVQVAVIEMIEEKNVQIALNCFCSLAKEETDYRSAVVIDSTIVRAIECERGKKNGSVIKLTAANYASAASIRMLFDGTLNREIVITDVTRAELKLSVSYIVTGIKTKKKQKSIKIFTGSEFEEAR